MDYEWNEAKSAANLAKHGVEFEVVRQFDWDGCLVRADLRLGYPETRLIAMGLIGQRLYVLVFTIRRNVRVISLRRASNREIERYEAEN